MRVGASITQPSQIVYVTIISGAVHVCAYSYMQALHNVCQLFSSDKGLHACTLISSFNHVRNFQQVVTFLITTDLPKSKLIVKAKSNVTEFVLF